MSIEHNNVAAAILRETEDLSRISKVDTGHHVINVESGTFRFADGVTRDSRRKPSLGEYNRNNDPAAPTITFVDADSGETVIYMMKAILGVTLRPLRGGGE
ncbi:hypothetical protein [Streptomyces formicae]